MDNIANSGLKTNEEDGISEEVQAQQSLLQPVLPLREVPPGEMAVHARLVALQMDAPDEMKALFRVIQLALVGGDLAPLGDQLTGCARQVWDLIVADVQQDDPPPDEMPDAT